MIRVCFVCLGNICRSPTASGIMRQLVSQEGLSAVISVESAGTGDWHVGQRPDARAIETARRRGFTLPGLAQQFTLAHFERYDYVVAMDRTNRGALLAMATDEISRGKVTLLRSFDPGSPEEAEVPDPYYGGPDGFEKVFEVCEASCRGLLRHLRDKHGL